MLDSLKTAANYAASISFRAVASCGTIALTSTIASAARSIRFGHLWIPVPKTAFLFCSVTSNLHQLAINQLKKITFVEQHTKGSVADFAFHVVVLSGVGTILSFALHQTAPYLGVAALTAKQAALLIGSAGIGHWIGNACYDYLLKDPVDDPHPNLILFGKR
jgi:hypothetical protein